MRGEKIEKGASGTDMRTREDYAQRWVKKQASCSSEAESKRRQEEKLK
jgi:hypothetical protein